MGGCFDTARILARKEALTVTANNKIHCMYRLTAFCRIGHPTVFGAEKIAPVGYSYVGFLVIL